ncbi:MAG: hypothetical protein KF865_08490 [Bdellovibrionaceae bacterium]|nr:hypothetical protein [Pseudobdellovibrionaceae bacterium]
MILKRSSTYAIVCLAGLALIQVAFYFLQTNQVQTSIGMIRTLLRQETSVSNAFLMSRTLSDLHDSGIVKCVRLTEQSTGQVHFDVRFKDLCGRHPFWLHGKETSTRLQGLNGEWWIIQFESRNGNFFFISLWLARILITVICIASLRTYFYRFDLFTQEQAKAEKLKNITEQAIHDVASPLTLLNVLYSSDLTSPEIKDLLGEAKSRMHGIIGSLKKNNDNDELNKFRTKDKVNITHAIDAVVKEKMTSYPNIIWHSGTEVNVLAEELELKRVLSNVLNNAIEANGARKLPIKISMKPELTQVSLSVEDSGIGIPPQILQRLGKTRVTHGKPGGSGLGLQHAFRSLDAWDGHIVISSPPNAGTLVTLIFRKA